MKWGITIRDCGLSLRTKKKLLTLSYTTNLFLEHKDII